MLTAPLASAQPTTPADTQQIATGMRTPPPGVPLDADGRERYSTGWTLHLDNDFLLPFSERDQDYTGGIGLTLSGRLARESWWSLDTILGTIDQAVGLAEVSSYSEGHPMHSAQLALLVFSPSDLQTSQVQQDDRPFANLIYLSNSRRVIKANAASVYQSTFTLGLLGTQLGAEIQDAIHELSGSDETNGWAHQISDGGEPTFRYSVSRQTLLGTDLLNNDSRYEVKYSLSSSIGYITETTASISSRWGSINTPWWSFTPENADYAYQPAPVIGNMHRDDMPELYFWGGAKLRARIYNALLQGQLRDSAMTYSGSELNPLIFEAWAGVTSQLDSYRLSYVLRYQSKEIKKGAGARNPMWGGLVLSASLY